MFEKWKGRSEIWLRLVAARESISTNLNFQDIAIDVNSSMLGDGKENCPMLHIGIEFSDSRTLNLITSKIVQHKTVIEGRKSFTIYNVVLVRLDGFRWNVPVRYSQIYDLRIELCKVLPSLRSLPFAGKTYLHWLSFICPGYSKFDHGRIQRRKKCMQEFLNVILENLEEVQSEKLASLLKLP